MLPKSCLLAWQPHARRKSSLVARDLFSSVSLAGGILRMLEVWAALLAQFFLTWLVTYIQGTSYLALGPFDLARLTWRLLSAAWEQFSQCLTTRVGRRLPVGRGEEEPVWSNWLVDATAATLLAGHKASVLLAGGWQRLRRGEQAEAFNTQLAGLSVQQLWL